MRLDCHNEMRGVIEALFLQTHGFPRQGVEGRLAGPIGAEGCTSVAQQGAVVRPVPLVVSLAAGPTVATSCRNGAV